MSFLQPNSFVQAILLMGVETSLFSKDSHCITKLPIKFLLKCKFHIQVLEPLQPTVPDSLTFLFMDNSNWVKKLGII